jgi:hypothetical protein
MKAHITHSILDQLEQSLTPEQREIAVGLARQGGWTRDNNPSHEGWHGYFATAKGMATRSELIVALERLLACPDLNLDDLEPETGAAMEEARELVGRPRQVA